MHVLGAWHVRGRILGRPAGHLLNGLQALGDDAIAALEAQLKQKLAESNRLPAKTRYTQWEEQVEAGRESARAHAERINQLSAELAQEIQALKAIADDIAPSYWQVYYKPFITGFRSISVPYVRSDGDVWTIVNRVV